MTLIEGHQLSNLIVFFGSLLHVLEIMIIKLIKKLQGLDNRKSYEIEFATYLVKGAILDCRDLTKDSNSKKFIPRKSQKR